MSIAFLPAKRIQSIRLREDEAVRSEPRISHRQRSEDHRESLFEFHLCGLLNSAVSIGWGRGLTITGPLPGFPEP
jgi:hypothetical protein